jgi:hypothetical protein
MEGPMPNFNFCYLHADGSLACTLAAFCVDEMQAKVLAHAMKQNGFKRFEVWLDERLIYERPETDDDRRNGFSVA